MKKIITITILFFCGQWSFAQAPWNAKVMLHNPIYGNVDTVWIGCDSAGGWGYQEGLDVIDTTLDTPFGLWADDSLISDGCFNLKKDIKNFVTGIQYYDLQMIDSGSFLPSDYIKIDTNEFKFDNGFYKITAAWISVLECGYVMDFDVDIWGFYNGGDTINFPDNPFYTDSITLIPESGWYCCVPLEYSQMRIRMWVAFNAYVTTGFQAIADIPCKIFPNPAHEFLFIQNETNFQRFEIINALGQKLFEGLIDQQKATSQINLSRLTQGIYSVRIFNKSEQMPVAINQFVLI
ncbi:MAG: T9SS type A sorting domain-containing protein [Chitinophagales bacterium]